MFVKSKKVISALIVFVIVFTYMGGTLEAIAATDGLTAITNGFFNDGEMKFNSYFAEEEKNKEQIVDVNDNATIVFDIAPNNIGKGFLKEGKITSQDLNGNQVNFKFSKIKNIVIDEPEETIDETSEESNIINEESADNTFENDVIENIVEEVDNTLENNTIANSVEDEKSQDNIPENIVEIDATEKSETEEEKTENNIENNDIKEIDILEENEKENTVSEDTIIEAVDRNSTRNEIVSRSNEERTAKDEEITENSEEFVNEEKIINDMLVEEETYEEMTAKDFEIEIASDNEISLKNVIYNTKIEVEIEYNKEDVLNIESLYETIQLQLSGTYINIDLERIEIQNSNEIIVGWTYNKEFDLSGKYTQFSPFKLGEHTGSIVENKINVKRIIEDENYLPIKQTTIEVEVPDYNGKQPEAVNVQSSKLMATLGEDLGDVSFNQENWTYDAGSKKIFITVTNENEGKAQNTVGEDEYVIVYRYNDYTEDENIELENNFKVMVEEYSANENIITTKQWNEKEQIKTTVNDLITYNIATTEESVNKSKINANYNSAEAIYETQYTSTVNVNVLTSDLIEELKVNSSKEIYVDENNVEFDALQDVYYSKVRFNYNEINSMLQNGATIEVQSLNGDLLYTLNNELVQNEENCEVNLNSKEHGINVIFKNISVNGNVSIEFVKTIGKSSYRKSAFNNFEEIKSYVSAELKYKNYDEKYEMAEICTSKKLSRSQTVAELKIANNNLNTIIKNNNVELKIELNNDKQDADLYINPSFELVFPKYVKDVKVESMNVMYAGGLKVSDFRTYEENEIVKMRIDLEGTQTTFSDSIMTNGTNILLNLDIELDEYTPKKADQIKMYYFNEGVTNYQSQTKWTIVKDIPNGILKDTNGFDVAIVNYQAPNGLITSNAIVNYDGKSSKIQSIAQGEKTAKIGINNKSQIAKMELTAMNNTENKCTDTVFVGRIPFEGNKSVVTNNDLGTTVTTTMLSKIEENIQNINMATIYYSTNENATKDLKEADNNWTTEVTDWKDIKSYMIVVKGEMLPGTVLKYSYDFEIPGGLYYDEAIYGSFGGFFNNNTKVAIYYESTEADKVGVLSEESLPLKLKLDVDAKNGSDVRTNQYLNYIVTVTNEGDETYSGITLNLEAPNYTYMCEPCDTPYDGNNGYDVSNNRSRIENIDKLGPGESKEFIYMVKVQSASNFDFSIKNEVKMTVDSLNGQEIVSNKTENKAIKTDFVVEVSNLSEDMLELNSKLDYRVYVANVTDEKSNEFDIVFNVPEGLEVIENDDENIKYDKQTRTLVATKDGLESHHGDSFIFEFKVGQIKKSFLTLKPYIRLKNGEVIYTTGTTYYVANADIQITKSIDFSESQITENQDIEFKYNFKNVGEKSAKDLNININLADVFENAKVNFTKVINGNRDSYEELIKNNKFSQDFDELSVGDELEVQINCKVKNIDKDALDTVLSKLILSSKNIETQEQDIKVSKIKDLGNNEEIQEEKEPEGIYEISGNVWVDENGDGQKIGEQKHLSTVQVQLLKNGNMIKATVTDSSGNYRFDGLQNGNYSVVYNYDKDNYTAVKYNETENEENITSKGYELEEGTAVSSEIVISDSNVENMNLGLQEKEKFDLSISQSISQAIVNIDGEETQYDYADLDLAKIEIEPNKINKAAVKFKYKIIVQNTGNVDGKVTSIVDYLPAGMSFKESENEGWSNGVDGNIYNDSLRDIEIKPGEVREIELILSKKFNEDNTGVLSNKVKIGYTENSSRLTECIDGNFATQETIVTVTQGKHTALKVIITTVSILGAIAIFAYMVETGRLEAKFNGKSLIKKIYK